MANEVGAELPVPSSLAEAHAWEGSSDDAKRVSGTTYVALALSAAAFGIVFVWPAVS